MKRYRALSAVLGVAAITGLMSSPAGAVPKNGETFVLDCDVLGTINVTTNAGNSEWTPAFVTGSNQRLIPYAFRFEFDGEVFEISKTAPSNGRLDRCEFSIEEDGGVVSAIVWLSYTPVR